MKIGCKTPGMCFLRKSKSPAGLHHTKCQSKDATPNCFLPESNCRDIQICKNPNIQISKYSNIQTSRFQISRYPKFLVRVSLGQFIRVFPDSLDVCPMWAHSFYYFCSFFLARWCHLRSQEVWRLCRSTSKAAQGLGCGRGWSMGGAHEKRYYCRELGPLVEDERQDM